MAEHECNCGDCNDDSEEYDSTEIILNNADIDELIRGLEELKISKKAIELPLDDNSGIIFVHEDNVEDENEGEEE